MKKIKVLVVDDSALIRRLFTDILNSDENIEVVDTAIDPIDARTKIKLHNPDVITLDIEMPKMDGITFLEKLMKLRPMPVVMISTLTHKGAECVMRCLELGAVDYMPKPVGNEKELIDEFAYNLIAKVKTASHVDLSIHYKLKPDDSNQVIVDGKPTYIVNTPEPINCNTNIRLVAIGSSTGGTEALAKLIPNIPTDFPPIVITQHIPSKFSKAFADRLDRNCAVKVVEAQDGDQIKNGHVYIAPGGMQMEVTKNKYNLVCKVFAGEKVNRHCPSVEVLFKSVANVVGSKVLCVMLTGMGDDGSASMKDIQNAGGVTIAQDEKSSVVWGMPGSAVKYGCVDKVVSLENIPDELIQLCRDQSSNSLANLRSSMS